MALSRVLHLVLVVGLHGINATILKNFDTAVESLIVMSLGLTSTDQEETTFGSLHVLEVQRELLVDLHLQFG